MPADWAREDVRVTEPLPHVEGLPRRRMVNSGGTAQHSVDWLLHSVKEALDAACAGLQHCEPRLKRARALLALPLFGTGDGGYATRRGEVIDGILERGRTAAEKHGIDIALVCHSRSDFSAVQACRSALEGVRHGLIHELGRRARSGDLALFLGAGVSVNAGLPSWKALLDCVAEKHGLPGTPSDDPDPWSAASAMLEQIGSAALRASVGELLSERRFALMHALLASLPCREVVTTNFDRLFEAARVAGRRPARLPYERGSADDYLLKLHGDADVGDLVLDRKTLQSYDTQRRPLAGLLQGLLLTRHLLFVGCSMEDDNVNRNIEPVVDLAAEHGHGGSAGTIITLTDQPAVRARFGERFDVVAADPDGNVDGPAARKLKILLDELLLAATYDEGGHLLDPDYRWLLEGGEQATAEALRKAAGRVPRTKGEWDGLRDALDAHGATSSGAPATRDGAAQAEPPKRAG